MLGASHPHDGCPALPPGRFRLVGVAPGGRRAYRCDACRAEARPAAGDPPATPLEGAVGGAQPENPAPRISGIPEIGNSNAEVDQVCRLSGLVAVAGACPEHGGFACLRRAEPGPAIDVDGAVIQLERDADGRLRVSAPAPPADPMTAALETAARRFAAEPGPDATRTLREAAAAWADVRDTAVLDRGEGTEYAPIPLLLESLREAAKAQADGCAVSAALVAFAYEDGLADCALSSGEPGEHALLQRVVVAATDEAVLEHGWAGGEDDHPDSE